MFFLAIYNIGFFPMLCSLFNCKCRTSLFHIWQLFITNLRSSTRAWCNYPRAFRRRVLFIRVLCSQSSEWHAVLDFVPVCLLYSDVLLGRTGLRCRKVRTNMNVPKKDTKINLIIRPLQIFLLFAADHGWRVNCDGLWFDVQRRISGRQKVTSVCHRGYVIHVRATISVP